MFFKKDFIDEGNDAEYQAWISPVLKRFQQS